MSSHFVGPLGAMVPLTVSAGAGVETSRPRSELITTGGVRWAQQARKAPRSWSVGRVWQDPSWVRMLAYAAQGVIAECYLYDVAVARQNLLRSSECVGTGSPVLVDGVPLGALATGTGPRACLLTGRKIIISCWTAATAGATVLTATHGGNTITLTAPPGTGARYAYATYTPRAEGVLTTNIVATLSGLRIHEGAPDKHFQTTQGTPCLVEVQDPSETLQMVTDGQTRIDYQVTLTEVGQPNF